MKSRRGFLGVRFTKQSNAKPNEHTNTLEMLGFILLLGALIRRETRRTRIRNPTYREIESYTHKEFTHAIGPTYHS